MKIHFKKLMLLSVYSLVAISAPHSSRAVSLEELLPEILENHERIQSKKYALEAAREDIEVTLGDWYPTVDLSSDFGREMQNKPSGSDDTYLNYKEASVEITQLITDFGVTSAAVDTSKLKFDRARLSYLSERQDLLSDAITAYVDVVGAWKVLKFAHQSEENIRNQTGLEEVRVTAGGGLTTDVLQSKSQLAGAQTRRIRADGKLIEAINHFETIFDFSPDDVQSLDEFSLPLDLKYEDQSDFDAVQKGNFKIQISENKVETAKAKVRSSKAKSFRPKIELSASMNAKDNVSGTAGVQTEALWGIKASMPLNLGFTEINSINSSRNKLNSEKMRLSTTYRTVRKSYLNALQEVRTSRQTLESLESQVGIAENFLKLSRQERELGQRSLIDVLAGETTLINAQSDAEAAKTDLLKAIISLQEIMGQLDVTLLSSAVITSEKVQ